MGYQGIAKGICNSPQTPLKQRNSVAQPNTTPPKQLQLNKAPNYAYKTNTKLASQNMELHINAIKCEACL
jgi:hypothetical protein